MNTFPTAEQARAGSRNNLVIHAEIRWIEERIYAAIAEGVLSLDIKDSPFTDPLSYDPLNEAKVDARDYYGALFSEVYNRSLKEQIDIVQKNFVDLGYQMTALKNTQTGNTFFWRILW